MGFEIDVPLGLPRRRLPDSRAIASRHSHAAQDALRISGDGVEPAVCDAAWYSAAIGEAGGATPRKGAQTRGPASSSKGASDPSTILYAMHHG